MAKIILKNIADHVGVSITTVSRVLNGQANKYRIKKETENSIIQAAKELGFNPYKSIYKSYSDTSQTIGLVVPDVSNFFLGNFARTIISQAQKFGFSIIPWSTYVVNLQQNKDAIYSKLNKKIRYDIRKAEQQKLKFDIGSNRESLSEYEQMKFISLKSLGKKSNNE